MAAFAITYGMHVFILIWLGQLLSFIGSGLTGFALGVWVYQRTGSVTHFTIFSLSIILPYAVVSPLAGTLVDRWSRRWAMILSDSGSALSTLIIVLLLIEDRLEVWPIYLATAVSSVFGAFQWPAYTAATTLLVPKARLGHASGMTQLSQATAQLISPLLGGVLLLTIGLQGIILLDFTTFLFALVTLFSVRFPEPRTQTMSGKAKKDSLLREAIYGWNYLRGRPGLLGLLIFFAVTNFLMAFVEVLATPLMLSITSPAVLGTVLSVGSLGMVVGSLGMVVWGTPRRRMKTVFGFMLLSGLCILVAGFRPFVPLLAIAAFLLFLGLPFIDGCSRVIFQQKVAPQVQGRVFALTGAVAGASLSFAYVLAGPLTDHVFEPLMAMDGPLAGNIGRFIGVGPGRGIGLLFIVIGILTILATVAATQYPHLRLVEEEEPDAISNHPSASA
jgi:MFS transporter, DHA3 family, macrolide efflux protein